ncbi:hypothetical protein LTR17_010787 [Elasticomyces elasticus]|nr:hypothetical protein LTR17_010787 [Elasticomyces elasticus]
MDGPPLASLSLTHVHYDPADPISHACAYLALVPQALVITYAALMWSTREVEIILMFAGQMGCEALNWVLKRTIREERPARAVAHSRIYLNYHTPRQVYAGTLTGVLCAVGWFAVISAARHWRLIDQALDTPLARWLRLRDLVVNEDLVDAGWERWELRRQRMMQQSGLAKKTT